MFGAKVALIWNWLVRTLFHLLTCCTQASSGDSIVDLAKIGLEPAYGEVNSCRRKASGDNRENANFSAFACQNAMKFELAVKRAQVPDAKEEN